MVATRLPRGSQAQEIPLGRFHAGTVVLRCVIGRGGIRQDKREGDRATPGGAFRPSRRLFPARQGFAQSLGFADAPDHAKRRLVRRS